MNAALQTSMDRAAAWSAAGVAAGWLEETQSARFAQLETAVPADLFKAGSVRPLVVAFFGGTGVGKSSLLNRLAGAPLARTGVIRPTSQEITLYVHRAVDLAALPPETPVGRVVVHRHDNPALRDSVWIDAPDINSTALENRKLALAWLPFVDLVVYVVSPERYRDDTGWRVLQERGRRHGWLFVMNHWDEGRPEQPRDFVALLRDAGFPDPRILCTCGLAELPACPTPDEFDSLAATISAILREHGLHELERLGLRARLLDLKAELERALQRLGDDAFWNGFAQRVAESWRALRGEIEAAMLAVQQSLAASLAAAHAPQRALLEPVRKALIGDVPGLTPRAATAELAEKPALDFSRVADAAWPAWAAERIENWLDTLDLELVQAGIRPAPVRAPLATVAGQLALSVPEQARRAIQTAAVHPGTPLRRSAQRVAGFLSKLLPTLTLLWIAGQVVLGYYRATVGTAGFLGVEFAAHSAVLLLIAWGVPFAAWCWLRPSLVPRLVRAQRAALSAALDQAGFAFQAGVNQAAQSVAVLRREGVELLRDVKDQVTPSGADLSSVSRLMQTGDRATEAALLRRG